MFHDALQSLLRIEVWRHLNHIFLLYTKCVHLMNLIKKNALILTIKLIAL